MTEATPDDIRDAILLQALPDVIFDGWTMAVAERAAVNAGYDRSMVLAVFPGGLADFVGQLSDWADRQMLARLNEYDPESMRVRDRVRLGVVTRLEILDPYREQVRKAMIYWALPHRTSQAGRVVWRTADRIWLWAGDTATDYNHYTKRGLLSGVISSTTLVWLGDESKSGAKTLSFLDRRIENVLELGKMIGRIKKTA